MLSAGTKAEFEKKKKRSKGSGSVTEEEYQR
jgi:hypothetical protein